MTGADIRAFRQRVRLSQRVLAEMLYMSQAEMSKWENDAYNARSDQIAKLQKLMDATPEELEEMLAGCPRMKRPSKQAESRPRTENALPCKTCPHWHHMDNTKSKTMYCACIQETGHARTCGVERTYQRYRTLSPLSLDAARAAELGVSYGQYKAL